MTKPRRPVRVETIRSRRGKREPRLSPIREAPSPATPAAPRIKTALASPVASPGALADDLSRILQGDRFPKWMLFPYSA